MTMRSLEGQRMLEGWNRPGVKAIFTLVLFAFGLLLAVSGIMIARTTGDEQGYVYLALAMVTMARPVVAASSAVRAAYVRRRGHYRLREDRCPSCGYSLAGLQSEHRCPECGEEYDLEAMD